MLLHMYVHLFIYVYFYTYIIQCTITYNTNVYFSARGMHFKKTYSINNIKLKYKCSFIERTFHRSLILSHSKLKGDTLMCDFISNARIFAAVIRLFVHIFKRTRTVKISRKLTSATYK